MRRGLAYVPQGRQVFPKLTRRAEHPPRRRGPAPPRSAPRRRGGGRHLPALPRLAERRSQIGRPHVRRRAGHARDRSGAGRRPAAAADRRAVRRAGADDRRGGVPHAAGAAGRRHDDGARRAEHHVRVPPRRPGRDPRERTGGLRRRGRRRSTPLGCRRCSASAACSVPASSRSSAHAPALLAARPAAAADPTIGR